MCFYKLRLFPHLKLYIILWFMLLEYQDVMESEVTVVSSANPVETFNKLIARRDSSTTLTQGVIIIITKHIKTRTTTHLYEPHALKIYICSCETNVGYH